MRNWLLPLGLVACASFLILPAGQAMALDAVVQPDVPFVKTITLNAGDALMYSWSADGTLYFTISDPDDDIIKSASAMMSFDTVDVDQSGLYTLTWLNEGSASVSLTYSISEFDLGDAEEWFEDMATIALIAGIVVIAVVVVVVVVVVLSGRKKAAQPKDQVIPQSVPGRCPMCMSDVGPQYTFCPRCGARMK